MQRRLPRCATMLTAGLALAVGGWPFLYDTVAAHMEGAQASTGWTTVQVSHDSFPAHAEPSLAVNPRNPRNLLGASQVFGPTQHTVGTFVSFDGGLTWRDNGPLPLPPGTNWADDVTAAFDAQGSGFVAAMATSWTPGTGLSQTDRGLDVWRTADGGRTFSRPVAAAQRQFIDHPWLAVDPTAGRGGGVYVAWVAQGHAALGFSRSTDGGHSFPAPHMLGTSSGGVSIPAVAAGPRGSVYVVFESSRQGADTPVEADTGTQGDHAPIAPSSSPQGNRIAGAPTEATAQANVSAQVEVVSSTDYGQHFGVPVVLGAVSSNLLPAPGVSLPTGPSVTTDPRDGAVYVAYVASHVGAEHAGILLAHSQDGGRTWSAPVHVTNTSNSAADTYFQPQVVVDDAGGVDVTYFALAHGHVDVYLARSTTHGASFQRHLRITPTSFDPALAATGSGGKHGLWWIGDYQGLAAGGSLIHPFWNDTRTGHLEIFTADIPITGVY